MRNTHRQKRILHDSIYVEHVARDGHLLKLREEGNYKLLLSEYISVLLDENIRNIITMSLLTVIKCTQIVKMVNFTWFSN